MPDPRPLLTIAVPTYNRSGHIERLLTLLMPQVQDHPEVEVYVADNASTDDTESIVRAFLLEGAPLRYERQPTNIGPDRNFVHCFEHARGHYFWICGDDDLILPGTVEKVLAQARAGDVDLMYLTSYAYSESYLAERVEDPLGRTLHTFTDPRQFAKVVNVMFTYISAMVINRTRLLELPHEEPAAFLSTYLVQLSWCLPLLLHHRKSVVLWDRPLAGRVGNGGGYSVGKVFGLGLVKTLARLLPGRPDLQRIIVNFTLRRWLPSVLYSLRKEQNEKLGLATAEHDLRTAYGSNFRFWLFAWPMARLPLPLARIWMRTGALLSHAVYILTVRNFWRKQS